MFSPYFFCFDSVKYFFGSFGIIPKSGCKCQFLFLIDLFFLDINVKDASSGMLHDPSSLEYVLWSCIKSKDLKVLSHLSGLLTFLNFVFFVFQRALRKGNMFVFHLIGRGNLLSLNKYKSYVTKNRFYADKCI